MIRGKAKSAGARGRATGWQPTKQRSATDAATKVVLVLVLVLVLSCPIFDYEDDENEKICGFCGDFGKS